MRPFCHRLFVRGGNTSSSPRVSLTVESLEPRLVPTRMGPPYPGNLQVQPEPHSDSRILVRFRPGQEDPHPNTLPRGSRLGTTFQLVPGLREVQLDAGVSVDQALTAFRTDPRVLQAEPNYRISVERMPNDPLFEYQWAANNNGRGGLLDADIDLPEAWDVTIGGPQTIIAILDTGMDLQHRDLASNLWRNLGEKPGNGKDDDGNGYIDDVNGYDFLNRDGDPSDDHGHGTHVAGILGAVGGNNTGITGVNWRARLMPLKFIGADGNGSVADAIEALNYAVAMGAKISNNSWGGAGPSELLREAIRNAQERGHIFVASAGNDGVNNDLEPEYPAGVNLDNVVAVAATDRYDQLAKFSNYGENSVHLGAPGVSILSTLPRNMFGTMSGTSMAAPYVAGVLSLVWERRPEWNYRRVIDQVLRTVDPLPSLAGKTITGGRVNARNALLLTPDDKVGPRVTDLKPLTDSSGRVDRVQLIFSEPIDAASFTVEDILEFKTTDNVDLLRQVLSVTGSGSRYFITFRPLTSGTYRLRLASTIYDLGLPANALDQNRDGRSGDGVSDQYLGTFTVGGSGPVQIASRSLLESDLPSDPLLTPLDPPKKPSRRK